MSVYQDSIQPRMIAYHDKQTARALAAGISHPLARLVTWLGRIIARDRTPDGPDYRDYHHFK